MYNRNICEFLKRRNIGMELTTIRELYKNRDSYMDQKVTIGGWVRSIRGSKHLDLS